MDSQEVAKVKQPPVLFSKTHGLIEKITEKLGAPMVTYGRVQRVGGGIKKEVLHIA